MRESSATLFNDPSEKISSYVHRYARATRVFTGSPVKKEKVEGNIGSPVAGHLDPAPCPCSPVHNPPIVRPFARSPWLLCVVLLSSISEDLKRLNSKLESAQTYVDQKRSAGAGKKSQVGDHSVSVVSELKSSLVAATKSFKVVVQERTTNVKALQERKKELGGSGKAGGGGEIGRASCRERV